MTLAPIVLFVYNRPWHTRQTLEALRKNNLADQSHLIIIADGPKENAKNEDLKSIQEVRSIIREKNWCKTVEIIESNTNRGIEESEINGITSVVNKYGKIIVLEDDIVTSPWFLKYMNDGLELYQSNQNVYSINGYMFPIDFGSDVDSFLCPIAFCSWGWATWLNKWKIFQKDTQYNSIIQNNRNIKNRFNLADYDYTSMLINLNTWDIRWYYSVFCMNGLALYPTRTMVNNIGFDGSGVHYNNSDFIINESKTNPIFKNKLILKFNESIDIEKYGLLLNHFKKEQQEESQNVNLTLGIKQLLKLLLKTILNRFSIIHFKKNNNESNNIIKIFIQNGRIPWSEGYEVYKWQQIKTTILNVNYFTQEVNLDHLHEFGKGIDERIIEYPWIFSNLSNKRSKLLDAGSTFNYSDIIEHNLIKIKDLSIVTYYPEFNCFHKNRISYLFNDLRELAFRDKHFDEIVCQSTLEHIDMDNTMYGYKPQLNTIQTSKSYEYMLVIKELYRVLKPQGILLITFPFGRFENHGFFQQFDSEMVNRIHELLKNLGSIMYTYFKYEKEGWELSNQENCNDAFSFNPHTGVGKGNDGAAHSRAICCIKFIKEA